MLCVCESFIVGADATEDLPIPGQGTGSLDLSLVIKLSADPQLQAILELHGQPYVQAFHGRLVPALFPATSVRALVIPSN